MTTTPHNRVARYAPTEEKVAAYRPRLDVSDLGASYELIFDAPGVSAFELSVDGGVLFFRGEVEPRDPQAVRDGALREYGVAAYERRVKLPEDVDVEAITANYEHGVLTVTAPKSARAQARTIPITMD